MLFLNRKFKFRVTDFLNVTVCKKISYFEKKKNKRIIRKTRNGQAI